MTVSRVKMLSTVGYDAIRYPGRLHRTGCEPTLSTFDLEAHVEAFKAWKANKKGRHYDLPRPRPWSVPTGTMA
jgi:hypothetical protein